MDEIAIVRFVACFLVLLLLRVNCQSANGCTDDPPEGAIFDCAQYAQLGLCNSILQDSCRDSCGKCQQREQVKGATMEQECIDVLLPGAADCSAVVEQQVCEDKNIKGIYCQKSCKYCADNGTSEGGDVDSDIDNNNNNKNTVCEDVLLPGMSDCNLIIQQDLCEEPSVQGIYCSKSCGQCTVEDNDTLQKEEDISNSTDIDTTICEDVFLPGMTDCNLIIQQSLCEEQSIRGIYCQNSCGHCNITQSDDISRQSNQDSTTNITSTACEDVLMPGISDCSLIVDLNLCEQPSVRAIYCANTCGLCNVTTTGQNSTQILPQPRAASQEIVDGGSYLEDCGLQESLECDLSALLELKGTVVGGDDLLTSWSGDNPCMDWRFVTCSKNDTPRVTKLEMDFFDTKNADVLAGSIIPQLSKLRFLEVINLDGLQFSGQLFSQFSVWTNLKEFQMVRMDLSSSLPPEYSEWKNLEMFRASYNSLSGKIPTEYTAWKNLNELIIAENRLSGNLPPEFSNFTKIGTFDAGANIITGKIPVEYSNLKNCFTFTLARNILTGTLPLEFSNWKKLDYFFISDNRLTGTLPVTYSEWENCNNFWVDQNKFSGSLPESYSRIVRMEDFDVSYNRLSGNLPVQYSRWRRLEYFSSIENNIDPSIPDEWSQVQRFADIIV